MKVICNHANKNCRSCFHVKAHERIDFGEALGKINERFCTQWVECGIKRRKVRCIKVN